jgi:hypothetical protein
MRRARAFGSPIHCRGQRESLAAGPTVNVAYTQRAPNRTDDDAADAFGSSTTRRGYVIGIPQARGPHILILAMPAKPGLRRGVERCFAIVAQERNGVAFDKTAQAVLVWLVVLRWLRGVSMFGGSILIGAGHRSVAVVAFSCDSDGCTRPWAQARTSVNIKRQTRTCRLPFHASVGEVSMQIGCHPPSQVQVG